MKTRQILALVAAASLMAASCQKTETVPGQNESSAPEGSIGFSAYTGTTTTKGTVVTATGVQTDGIGVFAFYQAAVAGQPVSFNTHKFVTPDFMYNQRVTCADSKWSYEPLKYWPNNEGDRLSFFGYAPYNENMRWDDLGISTSSNADKLSVSFEINGDPSTQKDILWAAPAINQSNKLDGGVNNPSKTISFAFRHITSKVNIQLGVDNPGVTGSTADAWTENYKETTIRVKCIKFTGLCSNMTYTYPITSGSLGEPVVSSEGSYELKVRPHIADEGTPTEKNYGKIYWKSGSDYWTAGWHPCLDTAAANRQYLFLAPQKMTGSDAQVSITYSVITKDAANSGNSSTISNTITKNLADILPLMRGSSTDRGFESGKAYNLNFLIGMDDVDFSVEVTDWDEVTTHDIDVPANFGIAVSSVSTNWAVNEVQSTGSGLAREGDILSFKVTKLGASTKFLCRPTPGEATARDSIEAKPAEADMVAGTLYKTTNVDTTTIWYKVPSTDPVKSIVIDDGSLSIKIQDEPDGKWTFSDLTCTGTGTGLPGEKIRFVVNTGAGASSSFLLKGSKGDTLVRDVLSYVPSTGKYTISYTVPEESQRPETITLIDYAQPLTITLPANHWSRTGVILCDRTGSFKAGEAVGFTLEAKAGGNGFAIEKMDEGNGSGQYHFVTNPPSYSVSVTLENGIVADTTWTVLDRSFSVSSDMIQPWSYGDDAECVNAVTGDPGFSRTGEQIKFTVSAKMPPASTFFYLKQQNPEKTLTGANYTITESPAGTYSVVYTIQAAETFPLDIKITNGGVAVNGDPGKWTVSGIACYGSHAYQSGDVLSFTLTPASPSYTAFKLKDQDENVIEKADAAAAGKYTVVENPGSPKTYTVSYTVPSDNVPTVIDVVDNSSITAVHENVKEGSTTVC